MIRSSKLPGIDRLGAFASSDAFTRAGMGNPAKRRFLEDFQTL
jgi:hypothetical protein